MQMKPESVKISTESMTHVRLIPVGLITTLLMFNAVSDVWAADLYWADDATPATAGSGTWTTFTGTGPFEWNPSATGSSKNTGWVDGSVAVFLGSAGGTVTLESDITAAGINFDLGANSFTIATNGNVLTIQGTGIVNNSETTQTIINNGATTSSSNGSLLFSGTTITGSVTINNSSATVTGTDNSTSGGFTEFLATSNAGSATINNNGGSVEFSGGATVFLDSSTAGNATINNKAGTVVNSNGFTRFETTSTAGSATINNNGGSVDGSGGRTGFYDSSTAGSATINNKAGSGVGSGGETFFFNNSNAGNAMIITNGGTGVGSGGRTFFFDSSDGGTARAITNGNGSFDISGLTTAGMGIGSIEGSGNYFLGSKTLTVGSNNLTTTVSGVIQDGGTNGGTGGSLTKVGTGTLTLTGTNTYTGTTTVDDGSLIVDGSIGSAQTVVNPGGLLGGIGFLRGDLLNSGTVSPGNPFGTLTVGGNYTQTASGTLRVSVGGLEQFSHLAVDGHATLGGNLQLKSVGNFKLQVGNTIKFLTAIKGVSGTFSTVQNPFISDTIVEAQVVLTPDSVEIEGTQGLFINIPGLTANEQAVAKALDSAAGDPRAAALFAFLNSQPLANLPHDLNLIAPAQISSMNATTVSLGKVQAANVGQRLNYIKAGGPSGFSSSGFGITGGAASFDEGFAGVSGPEGKAAPPVFAPTPENRWGVFVTGTGEFTNVDSTPNAAGYNVDTGGITLGIDYRLTQNFVIGLDGGYAHTNVSLDGGGNIDINAGTIGLYATVFGGGFYLDTAVSGGPSGYNTERTGLQGNASGSTNGGNIDFLVSGGYDWKRGNLSIGPTATFQFAYVGLNGFTETGSLAPLKFPDQNYESERTIFGAKASYIWKIGRVTLIPQVSAGWVHEYGSVAYAVVANFANGAGNSFTVNGPQIGRDGVLLTAGMSMLWTDRISTYIYYNGELARTNYNSNTVTGGVRISF